MWRSKKKVKEVETPSTIKSPKHFFRPTRIGKKDTTLSEDEAISITGPTDIPSFGLKRKKKKREFFFSEKLDEHWKAIIQEVRFRAFTHSSSFVGNVKYDQDLQRMEIILNGNTYTFCNVAERIFDAFEGSNSKGAYFNRNIKTQFDC